MQQLHEMRKPPAKVENEVLLAAVGIRKHFPIKGGFLQRSIAKVRAVDGVDLTVRRGETVALVGESGCGKTTLGRLLLRLLEPTAGDVLFNVPVEDLLTIRERTATRPDDGRSRELLHRYALTRLPGRRLKAVRRFMQPVFQDPFTSLDPRMLIKDILAEPLLINKLMTKEEAYERAATLLKEVGLRPDHLNRFPHEFSGGQRQRIAVARALAPEPQFLLLDEPTSALDVSVQAQILNLLKEIQLRQKLTYLLITHNLSVVKQMADRVAVMYLGKIVEEAATTELFGNPMHPYSKALLSAVPVPDPKRRRDRIILSGDVPSPIDPPAGCRFHTRCNAAMPTCGWSPREMEPMAAYLFDSTRNPDASGLPPIDSIEASPEELVITLEDAAATEQHRRAIESIVEARRRSAFPTNLMFQAVQEVRLAEGGISLRFLPAHEPNLIEVRPGHFCACLLYPTGIHGEPV